MEFPHHNINRKPFGGPQPSRLTITTNYYRPIHLLRPPFPVGGHLPLHHLSTNVFLRDQGWICQYTYIHANRKVEYAAQMLVVHVVSLALRSLY